MNALARTAISRSAVLPRAAAGMRQKSTVASFKEPTMAKTWLSDPSTYPILAVVGIAIAGCSSFITYKITQCPDVRVTSATKGKVIRTW